MSRLARLSTACTLALALVAGGCTSGSDGSANAPTTSVSETTAPSTTEGEVDAALPDPTSGLDGAIGEASDRVLGWFNGETFDDAAYESSFDETFRDAIAYAELALIVSEVGLDAPITVVEVAGSTANQAQLVLVGSSGVEAMLSVAVVSAEDATITGLFIGPAESPTFDAPATTAEAFERLGTMGTLRVGVFTDDCAPTALGTAIRAEEQAPVGSAFKLWVLQAVVEAVSNGSISWEDQVEIRDELDAYPSGTTQDDEPGTLLSVQTLAERMIEISDNTATNHLMDLVGRAAVEQAMIDSGHSDPSRNLPLMDAREFTIVKFGEAELRDRYIAADEPERRQILDDEVASMALPAVTNITATSAPIEVETLEWFASPTDLCQVLTSLADSEEATAIMSRVPGIPDETGRWETILFKGGSEPGVIAMAWLVMDDAGERYVIAGGLASGTDLIEEFEAASLFAFIRDTAVPS